jgi:hypothetical protein
MIHGAYNVKSILKNFSDAFTALFYAV